MMTSENGPSIAWIDFDRLVPNGAWVRWRVGAPDVVAPIQGLVVRNEMDEIKTPTITGEKVLRVTSTTSLEIERLLAEDVEYSIEGEWVDFRELCILATERRLEEARGQTPDPHPLQWMTHKDEINMSVAQIGTMLYETASWIEAQGNKGYSDNDLMKALPNLRIRLLGNAYKLAWENILFFGEGSRKRDFDGWGVHKYKPAHWTRQWLERFGLDHPQADTLTDQIWDEALAEYAKRAVKRAQPTYAGVDLEQELTRDVAHKAASMWLLSRWAQHRAWQHVETREMWMLQARLYSAAYDVFRHELVYRQDQQPEKRRSKKKTQAARDDWATASDYFVPNIGFNAYHFYTQAYVTACCEADAVPNLGIDHENLPRGIQAETLATQQSGEAEV